MRASDALDKQRSGEIEVVPPTFVTLHYLARHGSVEAALTGMVPASGPRHYITKVAASGESLVTMWHGDAGYEALDPSMPGPRHRLEMNKQGFVFDDSGVD